MRELELKQQILLGHKADPVLHLVIVLVDIHSVEQYLRVRLFIAVDGADQGGFSRSGSSEQQDQGAVGYGEMDVLEQVAGPGEIPYLSFLNTDDETVFNRLIIHRGAQIRGNQTAFTPFFPEHGKAHRLILLAEPDLQGDEPGQQLPYDGPYFGQFEDAEDTEDNTDLKDNHQDRPHHQEHGDRHLAGSTDIPVVTHEGKDTDSNLQNKTVDSIQILAAADTQSIVAISRNEGIPSLLSEFPEYFPQSDNIQYFRY